MARDNPRCFAWCVSLKTACNERWARFRNRFRRRFYAKRDRPVDQATILNETGTPDMVVSKVPFKANQVTPQMPKVTASPVVDREPTTYADRDLDKLVGDYVSAVISRAADTVISGQQTLDSTRITPADDNVSLTSSIISQIADIAVTESLTNIVLDGDTNQSARNTTRPTTIKEFMEMFGMTYSQTIDDGLPPVSC